jgi:hypothetical protein
LHLELKTKLNIRWLTHRNPINLGVVSLIIISVQHLLSESKGSTDGLGVCGILRSRRQVLVNVIHGWDDGADAGCIMRKKGCRV